MTSEILSGGAKVRLTPDRRRGELKAAKGSDGLVHVTWKDRGGSADGSLDLTVFPGDVTLRRIKTPRPEDRVWELRLLSGERRIFFWSQAAATPALEVAEDTAAKNLIDVVNNPAALDASMGPGVGAPRRGPRGAPSSVGGGGTLTADRLLSMLAAVRGSPEAPSSIAPEAAASATPAVVGDALQTPSAPSRPAATADATTDAPR